VSSTVINTSSITQVFSLDRKIQKPTQKNLKAININSDVKIKKGEDAGKLMYLNTYACLF